MTTSPHDTYTSPLASRNASPEMCKIWSPRHKFTTWRRIWLAVAEAQQACGLDISDEQLDEMRSTLEVTDEDMELAAKYERELRHDVMAHVHAWGDRCPKAKPIIHLGCTSQDVVCNADLIVLNEAAGLIASKIGRAILALCNEADKHKSIPTLGFTHYQPAQPVTVGRRCALWAHDLEVMEFRVRLLRQHGFIRFRGLRGATGSQASFLALFNNDASRVDEFEQRVIDQLATNDHYPQAHGLMGQTYPRFVDTLILSELAGTASVLHKIATDIRLLSNRKEIDEPFGKNQIGSSAMPYKRNPMKCERICGLTRFVMNLVGNAYDTAATQWLERTLDDSSNRRLSLPEAFLALDGALDLMHTVASGLVVNEAMVRKNLMLELPFMATENILMEAVKAGGDRQDLHEKIRVHSQAAGHRVKQEGLENDLIDRLRADPDFASIHHMLTEDQILNPMNFVGRSVEQTERFLKEVVGPLRERYKDDLESLGSADRGV
ncbi:MAG: adenylosuccinate lyase [Phycisphaerales bacterium]|nr:adenylosuccinate lyase [Phycisphaerales bacterium]